MRSVRNTLLHSCLTNFQWSEWRLNNLISCSIFNVPFGKCCTTETQTKWSPFSRWYFSCMFLKRKFSYSDSKKFITTGPVDKCGRPFRLIISVQTDWSLRGNGPANLFLDSLAWAGGCGSATFGSIAMGMGNNCIPINHMVWLLIHV